MPRTATQTAAKTQPKVPAKPQPKTQPRAASSAKGSHANLSRESIAEHLAAFRKRGGRIEILGITPLRVSVPPASRSKSAAHAKTAEKKA